MPWQPLPRIAFAVATYPFAPIGEHDLPLEIGDDLYIIEETPNGQWLRGYLLAPPSLTAGLTSVKGQTLEARVFSGIFPRSCVEIRELLGEADDLSSITDDDDDDANDEQASLPGDQDDRRFGSDSGKSGVASPGGTARKNTSNSRRGTRHRASESTTSAGEDNRRATRPLPQRLPGDPKPAAPVPMLRIGDESPTSVAEPLIDEIASCLREWHSTNLHELLLSRRYGSLDKVSQLIQALDLARRQFLHNVLTTKEYDELREKTVWNLVKGNKLCGGEVIVRDPQQRGRVLTGEDSVVEITKLQSVMSLLDEPPVTHTETTSLHHLMVDIRSFVGSSNEPITLLVSLVSRSVGGTVTALSESYAIEVPTGGLMGSNSKDGQMRTLFTDLTSADIGDAPSADSELFLVVKVRAPQQIMAGKPSSRSGSFSQPHAPFSKEKPPPSSSANKASRRSFMWGSTRSAFSRGGIKLDALSEQPEERPQTDRAESRDGPVPPSTAGSRGPRPSSDGTQVTHMTVDRMVGLGVLKINSIMQQTEEIEHIVTIWSATEQSSFDSQHDEECDIMVKHLLDSKTGHYERSSRAERLQVHLKPFNYQDPDALIKATPTLLSGISKTHKMGFPGAPTKPRSDIYITIHQALLARQNLLSRCGGSATSLPSNLHGNNLSVTVEVRSISGQRIDNCIYSASNSDAVSTWRSFAAERTERWNQCLRLALSPEEVMSCHVLVTLTDLPNAPFAIGYLPLWEQQAFISDGVHSLLLYKLEENSRTAQPGPVGQGGYLSAPWGPRIDQSDVTGPLATLQVESYLCSTRFSQDRVILGLLKWKEAPKDEIPGLLRQVIFVPEIEIVKLLHEVLDALFGVLVDNQENDEYEDLVFSALVRVLDIIHDRRFNLGPLVDQYAETRFNYPFATACLVRSFTRLLSKPTEPETARKLRATLKVVRYILKFITHARGQQKAKEAGIGIVNGNPGFTRHLQNIFKALDSMMRSTAPVLVGSQTLAVQHFHTWLPELTGLLTTEEILHIAIDFIDSCALVKGKLVLYKLVLIINYSKLGLFSHPDQRSALCANTARWIAPHWGETNEVTEQWKDQVRLCCSIVASQADHLGPEVPDYIPKITESFRLIQAAGSQPKNKLSLLFPASYPFPAKPISGEPVRFDEPLIELSAVLSALSNSPQGMQLELTEDDLASVLKNTLQVHMSIMQGEAFPASWLSVQIYHHKSTMKTLQYLSTIMLETFLPHPDDAESFDTELWKMFFTTLLKLVGSECLALETFPEQKRRAVWKIAGDVREDGAELLRRTWEAIGWETTSDERARYGLSKMGGYQVQYVPSLVAPIVELCLSVHEGLRRMAVEVLQTMIVSEWTLSDDLTVVQTEMIDCLDRFFKDKAMTESILQKLFVQELLDRFEPLAHIEDDAMYGGLRDLIATVDEFLDLLVAVHGGEVSGEASNLINRLRLMEFLRDMQKEEIFIRYVHQLAHLQAEGRNHTEAGLALKLHAELYEWDPTRNTRALVDPDMLEQTHFERKERIYFDMIKHFEDGEAWSSALAAYKELHNQYENNVFDFAKLARTERAIATIYETLAKSERLVPKYFKVVYKGLGFPASLRDKAFICEGSPNERTSAFTDRMQGQYQAAQIVTNGDVDSETEGQFLVVSSVSPHRDLSHPVFQRARVQQPIREYLLSAHPQMFSVSSRRNTNGPVATHHAEKTLYTTAESFPTILRRSEIIDVNTVHLGAKETGLERIVRKTQEMTAVEKRLGEGDEEVAQLLVDAIRISVNPKSENSVVGYRELLPKLQHKSRELDALDSDDEDSDDEDAEVEPELDEQENAIKMALVDHAIMLKRCLSNFARSTNPILRKAYQDLYMYFESTFAPEIAVFTPAVQQRDQSNTPSPTWQRSPRLHEGSPPAGQVSASGSRGVVEEAASAQPITLRQRGARLSFLGGKRKESLSHVNDAASGGGSPYTNGDVDVGNTASDKSKDNSHGPRMSFFRQGSHDNFHASHEQQQQPYSNGFSHHRGTPSTSTTQDRSLKSRDIVDVVEKGFERGGEHTASVEGGVYGGDGGLLKKPSIRKRFSTLKLGTKKSKNALMGDVREE